MSPYRNHEREDGHQTFKIADNPELAHDFSAFCLALAIQTKTLESLILLAQRQILAKASEMPTADRRG
jgi:hypothetical protein